MSEKSPVWFYGLFSLVLIVAVIGTYFWLISKDEHQPVVTAVAPPVNIQQDETLSSPIFEQDSVVEIQPPAAQNAEPAAQPLPELNRSDADIIASLSALRSSTQWLDLLNKEEIARKFVRAVYNLEQGSVVSKHRPTEALSSPFVVEKLGRSDPQRYLISSNNDRRYQPYIAALEAIEPALLVSLYRRYSPLLEQAFAELGVPDKKFDDVMLAAIDRVLAAPSINDNERIVVRPAVMYVFEDPALEALPPVHKLMLRMGQDNAQRLKSRMASLRAEWVD